MSRMPRLGPPPSSGRSALGRWEQLNNLENGGMELDLYLGKEWLRYPDCFSAFSFRQVGHKACVLAKNEFQLPATVGCPDSDWDIWLDMENFLLIYQGKVLHRWQLISWSKRTLQFRLCSYIESGNYWCWNPFLQCYPWLGVLFASFEF